MSFTQIARGELVTSNQILGFNDVGIAPNAVSIPLGKIVLVHKGSEYGAVKFNEFWTGKTKDEEYAIYESYYQSDKSGDFSNKNVKYKKEKLSFPKSYGIGRLAFVFGKKIDVKCGNINLLWSGKSWLYFYSSKQDEGNYGIELAPTIWTDISQVNVFDPRIKWYKYDEKRPRQTIPIDKLWENEIIKK